MDINIKLYDVAIFFHQEQISVIVKAKSCLYG